MALVFGDTNSTLAGALAATKLHIEVCHIEAGLRAFDKNMPEEINRVLVDHCSDLLFCPTQTAVGNLRREGIKEGIYLTGDVMVDAVRENVAIAEQKSTILDALNLRPNGYHLATIHRQENTDNPRRMANIVAAFCEIPNLVFPCHPRTQKRLERYDLWEMLKAKVNVIRPVGYLNMLMLMKNAKKIFTDSGGVQKEAYLLKVPCITLRESTEWVETITDGWNVLVGVNTDTVLKMAREFKPSLLSCGIPFGDGKASERMSTILTSLNR